MMNNNIHKRSEAEKPRRISFLNNDSSLHTSMLTKLRANPQGSSCSPELSSPRYTTSLQSQQNEISDNLGGNGTVLLKMIRARSQKLQREIQNQNIQLITDDISDDQSSEACVHGFSVGMAERSVSRSRMSRASTRRDMDIASILAYNANISEVPTQFEIPHFEKMNATWQEEIPRWSIRRSVCPVCSQKWKDRSSITNVKYSGLKKNSSSELPSVIAPARLRASITAKYIPRPALAAVDEDIGATHSGLPNTGASWQLTRARRFRTPKRQLILPGDISTASKSLGRNN